MAYKVQSGDSPARIAQRHGLPMHALIAANPHKATHVVAGQRTWQALGLGESLNMPVGVGAFAPAAPGAPHGQIKQGSQGPDVALWQTIIGVTADGIFGPKTASATKAWQGAHGLAADGIVGPKTWGAALGGMVPSAPMVTPASMPSFPSLPSLPVSLPSMPLPVSLPTPSAAPAAVQALASVDPCYSGNVMMVCAAQAALGVMVDGKYGNDTATALRRYVPNAPAGCSPRPSWWTPVGGNNCGGGAAPTLPIPQPIPMPAAIPSAPWVDPGFVPSGVIPIPMAPAPAATPTQASIPSAPFPVGPAQPLVASPEKKGISTGAMVAGALGVAALVGVVAVAATGKKRGGGVRRAPTRKSTHKKKRR